MGPYSYLLESAAQGGEKWSRFSIVGLPATKIIKISGQIISTFESGDLVDSFSHPDPLHYIEEILGNINYPILKICLFIPVDLSDISVTTLSVT